MSILKWLKTTLTWWNGKTVGTLLYTFLNGKKVGEDHQGNCYYVADNHPLYKQRRWVIYADQSEASKIPADWHAWMHHITDAPPSDSPLPKKSWEKPHQENLTGQLGQYVPSASLLHATHDIKRPQATGDYTPWTPQ